MTIDHAHLKPEVRKTLQVLLRDGNTPELGVHVMSEFMYCPRAGIIAAESHRDDMGMEEGAAPALGGIPRYDIDRMLRDLESRSKELKHLVAATFSVVLLAVLCSVFSTDTGVFVLGLGGAVLALLAKKWWPEAVEWWQLRGEIRRAQQAVPREPDWDQHAQQQVDWWELIAAGFESIELTRALSNHEVALTGRPWRVLHRGHLRIPVLRVRVEEGDGPIGQFRPRTQQQARIAAYAFLTETCERGNADWAIVLFNSSDRGVAFPVGSDEWDAFRQGLPRARREFGQYMESPRYRPRPADHGRACSGCPFGEPRMVGLRPTILNGVEILPRKTTDNLNREFHCTCYDRFGDEVPPHKLARQLGLTD